MIVGNDCLGHYQRCTCSFVTDYVADQIHVSCCDIKVEPVFGVNEHWDVNFEFD